MKKIVWVGPNGEVYNTQDDAWDDAISDFGWPDFFVYIDNKMSFEQFFDRVCKMPGFWDEFYKDFSNAEEYYFNSNYKKKEIEIEEDE